MRRFLQRGDGKIGAIVALLILLLIGHVGFKLIPHKIRTAEFESLVEEKLTELAGNVIEEDQFFRSVTEKAEELELPIFEDMMELDDQRRSYKISLKYSVPLDMIWGEWVQEQTIELTRQKF